jgi:hypothetical protein
MTKRSAAIVSTVALTIALAAFTGSALAENGNGGATSQATPAGQTASQAPGNSANAPGQLKKAAAATTDTAQGSAAQNSTAEPGMKPTNATDKNTSCTTGGSAGSVTCPSDSPTAAGAGHADASKKYGNGSTAAQIATTNGAPAGTSIFGPGNSQPHKVATCPHPAHGNGGGVDVHALKPGEATASCTTSVQTQTQTTVQTVTPALTQVFGATTTQATTAAGTAVTTPATSNAGGVLGTTAGGKAAKGKPFGGVLGALATVGHGTLPFTGFPLWIVVAIGAVLLTSGLGLTRRARATA